VAGVLSRCARHGGTHNPIVESASSAIRRGPDRSPKDRAGVLGGGAGVLGGSAVARRKCGCLEERGTVSRNECAAQKQQRREDVVWQRKVLRHRRQGHARKMQTVKENVQGSEYVDAQQKEVL
jgi:hypothetical protein